jgi:hypothetical protein
MTKEPNARKSAKADQIPSEVLITVTIPEAEL